MIKRRHKKRETEHKAQSTQKEKHICTTTNKTRHTPTHTQKATLKRREHTQSHAYSHVPTLFHTDICTFFKILSQIHRSSDHSTTLPSSKFISMSKSFELSLLFELSFFVGVRIGVGVIPLSFNGVMCRMRSCPFTFDTFSTCSERELLL